MSDTPAVELVDNIVTALVHAVLESALELCIGLGRTDGCSGDGAANRAQSSTSAEAAAASAKDTANGGAPRRSQEPTLHCALGGVFSG